MNSWHPAQDPQVVRIPFRYEESTLERFQPQREFSPAPFVPRDAVGLSDRCQLILTMQSVGLASRLAAIHGKVAVVGLSGGLDSTLALLVTARAFDRLGLPREGIHAPVSYTHLGKDGCNAPKDMDGKIGGWDGLPAASHRPLCLFPYKPGGVLLPGVPSGRFEPLSGRSQHWR